MAVGFGYGVIKNNTVNALFVVLKNIRTMDNHYLVGKTTLWYC